jgi:hypothetical protein
MLILQRDAIYDGGITAKCAAVLTRERRPERRPLFLNNTTFQFGAPIYTSHCNSFSHSTYECVLTLSTISDLDYSSFGYAMSTAMLALAVRCTSSHLFNTRISKPSARDNGCILNLGQDAIERIWMTIVALRDQRYQFQVCLCGDTIIQHILLAWPLFFVFPCHLPQLLVLSHS